MEDLQSWLANVYNPNSNSNSNSNSPSSSATTSHETHNAPTLCEEDSSFNSLESYPTPHYYNSVSHFCIASIKTRQITCLAVQNNNLYAASLNEINVFDLTTLSLVETFGSGSGWVKSIAFSSTRIFTAHHDCKIRVWQQVSTSSGKQKHQLISTLPTLKDRFFNCLLAKNYVQIRRHKQKLWIEHADTVSCLAVQNDVGLLYSSSWDKSFKTWKLSSGMRCVESVRAHSDAVNAIAVSPSDQTVYTGCADGQIKVWKQSEDGKKHSLLTTLTKHESSVNALALTRDGSGLCSGGGDRVILVWERDDSENEFFVSCRLEGHNGPVLCLVHVNGVLISGSSDRSVRIWNVREGSGRCCLGIMEGHCKPVKSVVVVPGEDCLTVFSGSLDGEIRAWKVVIN